eukprot:356868-Chlamydomonas_euryale.AAC.10
MSVRASRSERAMSAAMRQALSTAEADAADAADAAAGLRPMHAGCGVAAEKPSLATGSHAARLAGALRDCDGPAPRQPAAGAAELPITCDARRSRPNGAKMSTHLPSVGSAPVVTRCSPSARLTGGQAHSTESLSCSSMRTKRTPNVAQSPAAVGAARAVAAAATLRQFQVNVQGLQALLASQHVCVLPPGREEWPMLSKLESSGLSASAAGTEPAMTSRGSSERKDNNQQHGCSCVFDQMFNTELQHVRR